MNVKNLFYQINNFRFEKIPLNNCFRICG